MFEGIDLAHVCGIVCNTSFDCGGISCMWSYILFLGLGERLLSVCFCGWQVYVTMYLNDAQRSPFYESLGLNTRQFDMHVIIEVCLLTALFKRSQDVSCMLNCIDYQRFCLTYMLGMNLHEAGENIYTPTSGAVCPSS